MPVQPLAAGGVFFSGSVLPALDLSSVQPLLALVAQPVTERPAPLSRAARLSPASSFFRSVLSIISSLLKVNYTPVLMARTARQDPGKKRSKYLLQEQKNRISIIKLYIFGIVAVNRINNQLCSVSIGSV